MNRLPKVCIILNPIAGHGKALLMLPQVKALLKDNHIHFDLFETDGPKHAETLAKDLACSDYRAIVAMGGDGTLGEVANGLLASNGQCRIPLAIIPAGTGNDFVKGNRLFFNWVESVNVLSDSQVTYFDVMYVQDALNRTRYAVNSVGVGFDAYVVKQVAQRRSKKFGRLSYALEVVRGLYEFQPRDMRIVVDAEEKNAGKAWLCAVLNSEKFGGGMKIAPGAGSADGNIHIAYLTDAPRLRLLHMLVKVFKGKHVGTPGVYIHKALEVQVDADSSYPCHLDGDILELTYPLKVKLVPGAIPFLIGK